MDELVNSWQEVLYDICFRADLVNPKRIAFRLHKASDYLSDICRRERVDPLAVFNVILQEIEPMAKTDPQRFFLIAHRIFSLLIANTRWVVQYAGHEQPLNLSYNRLCEQTGILCENLGVAIKSLSQKSCGTGFPAGRSMSEPVIGIGSKSIARIEADGKYDENDDADMAECLHKINQLNQRFGAIAIEIQSEFKNKKWAKFKPGTLATTASMLAKAVNNVIREREAEQTEVGGFVSTRLAEAIFDIVQYAMKRRQIAVFLVPAGSGKSMALNALEIETPGAVLITVKRSRSTIKSFLQLWARQLGKNETGRAEDIQDRIVECLQGSSRLMLIDEAHKLTVAALDAAREMRNIFVSGWNTMPGKWLSLLARRISIQIWLLLDFVVLLLALRGVSEKTCLGFF